MKRRKWFVKGPMDKEYLLLALILLAVGLLMLLSASYPSAYFETDNPYYYFQRQALFAAAGLVGMLFVSKLDYDLWRHWAIAMLLVSFLLLGAVLIPGIGGLYNNARRWIEFRSIHFQPSEFAKLAVIVAFSASIAKKKERMRTFRYGILPYAVALVFYAALLMAEPHLSGTILICAIGAVLLFVGGIPWWWIALGLGGAGGFGWLMLSGKISYGQDRIAMWLDPFIDAQNEGYQLAQSLIAIGSGGLTGVGLGQSRQKYLYLPEEHNDFIFSVICEEVGLIGATMILLVFAMFIIRGYVIARSAKDRFGSLLAVGVTTHFALQTFMNVGVVSGLLPTTGVSLPFFSYGGTALLCQLAEVGIVLSITRKIGGGRNEKQKIDSAGETVQVEKRGAGRKAERHLGRH